VQALLKGINGVSEFMPMCHSHIFCINNLLHVQTLSSVISEWYRRYWAIEQYVYPALIMNSERELSSLAPCRAGRFHVVADT
jgi:hypothetical protein